MNSKEDRKFKLYRPTLDCLNAILVSIVSFVHNQTSKEARFGVTSASFGLSIVR